MKSRVSLQFLKDSFPIKKRGKDRKDSKTQNDNGIPHVIQSVLLT